MKQGTTITILPQKYHAMSKCVKRSLFETNHPCPNKAIFVLGGFEIGKRMFGAGKSEMKRELIKVKISFFGIYLNEIGFQTIIFFCKLKHSE